MFSCNVKIIVCFVKSQHERKNRRIFECHFSEGNLITLSVLAARQQNKGTVNIYQFIIYFPVTYVYITYYIMIYFIL